MGSRPALRQAKPPRKPGRRSPPRARQKDVDARWTVKFSKAKPREVGTTPIDIAIPTFGYKSHISIDRRHGIIRRGLTTDAAAHDGARLRERLIDLSNTTSDVWADTAHRSKANEDFLDVAGKVNRIHRKKPRGKPIAKRRPGLVPTNRRCGPCRASLRAPEAAHGAGDPHHRHREGAGDRHARKHGLQNETIAVARQPT